MADTSIKDLAPVTAPLDTDLLPVVVDPLGSPVTRNANVLDVLRQSHGEISVTSGVATQTLTGGATFDLVTQFTADGISKETTPTNGTDVITLADIGVYVATWQVAWTGAAATYNLAIFWNGAQVGGFVPHVSGGTGVETATVTVLFSATSPAQDLDTRVNETGGNLFDVTESNLMVRQIGTA